MALKYTGGYGKPPGYKYVPDKSKAAPAPPAGANKATGTFGENPEWRQQWADQYSALNPTWESPEANAVLPRPIHAVKFNPLLDPTYAGAASNVTGANERAGAEYGYTDENGVFHPGYQTHQTAQTYGYDQNGNLITSGADLNPYAQAAIMKRNYDNSVRGTTNSYAARGQLYSGALNNAQGANDWNYGVSSDQLKRTAMAGYHGAAQAYQGVLDSGTAQLAALFGPAFNNWLAGQKGS